jgi:hypothetical protein
MAVVTAPMMLEVHFVILAVFLSLIDLLTQFIRFIDRVLPPYALLTNVLISCQLFATLPSAKIILRISVVAMFGRGSRD